MPDLHDVALTDGETDVALFLAAMVIKAGGRIVLAPGEMHGLEHIDLEIQELPDGGIEFVTRTVRAEVTA